jgi:hypothetical protein
VISGSEEDYTMAMVRKRKYRQCVDCKNCCHLDLDNSKKLGPFKQVQRKHQKKKIYLIESCNSSTFNIS